MNNIIFDGSAADSRILGCLTPMSEMGKISEKTTK
jgi:hypothetical protein